MPLPLPLSVYLPLQLQEEDNIYITYKVATSHLEYILYYSNKNSILMYYFMLACPCRIEYSE